MYKLNFEQLRNSIIVNNKLQHNRSVEKDFLPFPSRQPERYKFKNSSNGILGAYFRSFTNENIPTDLENAIKTVCQKYINSTDNKKKAEVENFLLEYLLDDQKLLKLTDISMFKKLPLSTPMKTSTAKNNMGKQVIGPEGKGELLIANFLSHAFPLDDEMLDVVNKKNTNKVLATLFEQLELSEEVKNTEGNKGFGVFFEHLKELYQEDVRFLSKNKNYFLESFEYLLMHYYFVYISQFTIQCGQIESKMNTNYPLYYTYETEKASKTRDSYNQGYQKISKERESLFFNMSLLTHLNFTNEAHVYSLDDIVNQISEYDIDQLVDWIETYLDYGNFNTVNSKNILDEFKSIKRNPLIRDIINFYAICIKHYYRNISPTSLAVANRYQLSIDEIGKKYFYKKRGNLGYMLNITQDMLVLLVRVCVKDNKMHIKDLFIEFEKRGVFLDRYSKEHIIEVLGQLNLIIKQSDSGEVQYVKSIL